MQRSQNLVLGICLTAVLLAAGEAQARRPRRGGGLPPGDPLAMGSPVDMGMFESSWGPAIFHEYGCIAPQSGSWDDLLKSGPSSAVGVRWKYADFAGDILPASSTYLQANYRYAYLRGDEDVQLLGPNGFVGDVANMRLNLMEVGVTQRFMGLSRRGMFVDFGASLGAGGADGKINPVARDLADEAVVVGERNSDGLLLRGELTTGLGLQFRRCDLRFGATLGLNGTSALDDNFRTQQDVGARLGTTWFLWD